MVNPISKYLAMIMILVMVAVSGIMSMLKIWQKLIIWGSNTLWNITALNSLIWAVRQVSRYWKSSNPLKKSADLKCPMRLLAAVGDPAVLVASNEKAKKLLGWELKQSSLENILRTAYGWEKKINGIDNSGEKPMNYIAGMKNYFEKEKAAIDSLNLEEMNRAVNAVYDTWQKDGIIYTMGNGGSAATASHMVCDFNKGVSMETGKRFKMICLSDNTPIITAIANDIAYDEIFRVQLRDVVKKGDLLIAVSGSGNSANVLDAVTYAKEQGAQVIAMTGYNGGKLMQLADYNLHVPVNDMQIAEDIHMVFVHLMMRLFNDAYGKGNK